MFKNTITLLASVVLLILALVFSAVVLAVIAVLGLVVWVWFLWKTRKLRRAMREQTVDSQVIDGEAIVVEEHRVGINNVRPDDPPRQ